MATLRFRKDTRTQDIKGCQPEDREGVLRVTCGASAHSKMVNSEVGETGWGGRRKSVNRKQLGI